MPHLQAVSNSLEVATIAIETADSKAVVLAVVYDPAVLLPVVADCSFAVDEDIPEEGVDLEAVDHRLAGQGEGILAAVEGFVARRVVFGAVCRKAAVEAAGIVAGHIEVPAACHKLAAVEVADRVGAAYHSLAAVDRLAAGTEVPVEHHKLAAVQGAVAGCTDLEAEHRKQVAVQGIVAGRIEVPAACRKLSAVEGMVADIDLGVVYRELAAVERIGTGHVELAAA